MSISGTSTRERPVALRRGEYQQYDPARVLGSVRQLPIPKRGSPRRCKSLHVAACEPGICISRPTKRAGCSGKGCKESRDGSCLQSPQAAQSPAPRLSLCSLSPLAHQL